MKLQFAILFFFAVISFSSVWASFRLIPVNHVTTVPICYRPSYDVIPIEFVCGNNVYFIRNKKREWVGKLTSFNPMPKAHPPAYQTNSH